MRGVAGFMTVLLTVCCVFMSYAESPVSFDGSEYARVSVVVRDIKSGRYEVSYNAGRLMTPASTMKLVTAAAALLDRGADFRYATEAYFNGSFSGDRAVGDIVVRATGDPTLYSGNFTENQTFIDDIVASVKSKGVKEICGDIVIDDRCMPDGGPLPVWLIEDAFYGYGTGCYALNCYDNEFKVCLDDMSTVPELTGEDVVHEFVAGEDLRRFHGAYGSEYVLRGDAPEGTRVVLPMSDPAMAFTLQLTDALEKEGIRFSDEYVESGYSDRIPLAEYRSPELGSILQSMMFRSDNMIAESSLRLLAPYESLQGALEKEKAILRDSLGIENRYVRVMDGSGLSRKSLVSADFLCSVLYEMARGSHGDEYAGTFARVGHDGTLKRFLSGSRLKGRMRLKSGSMNGVRCYAGYFLNNNGEPQKAVVVMVNDFVVPTAQVNAAIEKFMIKQFVKK